jgi:hypothetical protein
MKIANDTNNFSGVLAVFKIATYCLTRRFPSNAASRLLV